MNWIQFASFCCRTFVHSDVAAVLACTHRRKNCTNKFEFYSFLYETCVSLLMNEIRNSWMLYSCRNKTCIKFYGLFWFAIWGAFCRHEQRMKMTQILQLYLKESRKLMETLGRLSYCIAPLVYLRRLWKNSVRIVWSLELFNVLHQFHPHWHCGPIPAFGAPSFWSCRLQWLPEIRMTSNLGVYEY